MWSRRDEAEGCSIGVGAFTGQDAWSPGLSVGMCLVALGSIWVGVVCEGGPLGAPLTGLSALQGLFPVCALCLGLLGSGGHGRAP